MRQLAHHYNVTLIDTCAALMSLKSEQCSSERKFRSDEIFDDILHYSAKGSGMQGCLAAHVALSSYRSLQDFALSHEPAESTPLANPLWPKFIDSMDTVYFFSTDRGFEDTLPPDQLNGWRKEIGGRGNKQWYTAGALGQAISFKIPPSTRIEIEFYRHPDLPMGLVEILIDGKISSYIDSCCPENGCEGIPEGQGFYYREIVGDELPFQAHHVQLRTVDRKGITTCKRLGNKFDLKSVVGKARAHT